MIPVKRINPIFKTLLIAIIFIFQTFTSAYAGLKSEGKTHLKYLKDQNKVEVSVEKGFHFNIKAPTFLKMGEQRIKPSQATEKLLQFPINEQIKGKVPPDAKINYYVCDDANTVCEPHEDLLAPVLSQNSLENSIAGVKKLASTDKDTANQKVNISVKNSLKPNHANFIKDDLNFALTKAKKDKKLVFIDFMASWCPPCIRLEHETFNTTVFQKVSKDFVLVRIDVDKDENQKIKDQYQIKAFPTLVITNDKGQELDRILDFLPAENLALKLKQIQRNPQLTNEGLKMKGLAGDKKAAKELGMRSYRALQYKECMEWFDKAQSKPIEYYQCSIGLSDESYSNLANKLEALTEAIKAFPNSFYSIDWRLQSLEMLKESKTDVTRFKQLNSDTEKLIHAWINDPQKIKMAMGQQELMELKDLVLPELYYSMGSLLEMGSKKEEALKYFNLAVEKTKSLSPDEKNPTLIIYLVHYMKKTHPVEEGLSWLQKLVEAYPVEFTYVHRQASLLSETKQFEKALPFAEQAFKLSYGNNRLKTGLLLAKIEKELQKKKEAKTLLEELKSSAAAQYIGNKYFLDKIEKAILEL